MRFVVRMAWRETRASWARLALFFLSVGLGVAAIVVLRSVVGTIRETLTSEARSLLGADLVVDASRPLPADVRARVAERLSAAHATGTTDVVETQTMASASAGAGNGGVKLVELRAVDAGFPFYGTIELDGGKTYSHALLEHHGILVEPTLATALGLEDGDPLILAGQTFTIRGIITRDRVARTGFALGPRVYMDLADLRQTSLLGFGSRASYELLARVPDAGALPALVDAVHGDIAGEVASVRSWQMLEDRIGDSLTIAENYLSLVGFVVVVIGGIGVWSVTRVIVQQKIRSVAVLKCLGASSRRILGIYVLQAVTMSAAGGVAGLVIAAIALRAIPSSALMPLGVAHVSIRAAAAVQGVAVGLLVSVLFALVPLLEMRRVKPLLLLRAATSMTRARDWQSVAAAVAVTAALAAVAVWQAGSLRAGLYVSAGLAIAAGVLYGASRVLLRVTRPLTRSPRFSIRHAVIGLGRPGNQARVILMAVGLGTFLILGVRAVQANLVAEFEREVGRNSPDVVVIDIQRDEVDRVAAVAAPFAEGGVAPRIVPLMRARIVAVDGRRVHLATPDDVRRTARLSREFGLTYRASLDPNERVDAGRFWTSPLADGRTPDGADTEVSIEHDLQAASGIELGDLIEFDLAGTRLRARVTNVRTVAWDNAQNGGFVFVLRPGPAVDRAPHDYVAFLQVAGGAQGRGAIERQLVAALPNVSVIDVHDVLASVRDVVDNATLAITVVGAVTLAGGVLILVGAVIMTKFQRLYDASIYRALGASTRRLVAMTAIEYGLLGLLAGVLGAIGAMALSWTLARRLFDIDWQPTLGLFGAGVLLVLVTVCAVGLAASADVLVRKPLQTLRGE